MAPSPCGPLFGFIMSIWALGTLFFMFILAPINWLLGSPELPIWVALTIVAWLFVFPLAIGLWACTGLDVYHSFPFSLFWDRVTVQSPYIGWKPSQSTILCDRCAVITRRSRLLRGSWGLFVRRIEWYDSHETLRELSIISRDGSCQLCSVLWNSIPVSVRQERLKEEEELAQKIRSPLSEEERSNALRIHKIRRLRVRIWEELDGLQYEDHEHFLRICRGSLPLCRGIPIRKLSESLPDSLRCLRSVD